ncbi:hypothetical protein HDV05_005674 [Chytridiales sp. JEL 0842]|nr:hypothetical protein HDV05_005674 [Chytridiales sp. JEL 0842]
MPASGCIHIPLPELTFQKPPVLPPLPFDKITSAVSKVSPQLYIILTSPSFAPPGSATVPPTQSWSTIQSLLSELYTCASNAAYKADNPLLDINVILDPWCGYDPWLKLGSVENGRPPMVLMAISDEEKQWFQTINQRRESSGLKSLEITTLVSTSSVSESQRRTATSVLREYSISSSLPDSYESVALGGTFDHLHSGHKILLTTAAWLTTRRLVCGVMDYSAEAARLARKSASEFMEPLEARLSNVKAFLNLMRPSVMYDVVPIKDDFGPTRDDADIFALVGSAETERGCFAVNELRATNELNKLDLFIIDVIAPDCSSLSQEDMMCSFRVSFGPWFLPVWLVRTKSLKNTRFSTHLNENTVPNTKDPHAQSLSAMDTPKASQFAARQLKFQLEQQQQQHPIPQPTFQKEQPSTQEDEKENIENVLTTTHVNKQLTDNSMTPTATKTGVLKTPVRIAASSIPQRSSATPKPRTAAAALIAANGSAKANGRFSTPRSAIVTDEAFEFNAPKFHDFTSDATNNIDDGADKWFDGRLGSPAVEGEWTYDGGLPMDDEDEIEPVKKGSPLSARLPKSKKFSSVSSKLATTSITAPSSSLQKGPRQPSSKPANTKSRSNSASKTDPSCTNIEKSFSNLKLGADKKSTLKKPTAPPPAKAPVRKSNLTSSAPAPAPAKPTTTSRPASLTSAAKKSPEVTARHASAPKPAIASLPKPPARPLTVPKEFSFVSRDKHKIKIDRPRSPGIQKRKPIKKSTELTIPKPFNFHSSLRKASGNTVGTKSPYVPLAIRIKKFEAETPDRFKATAKPQKVEALKPVKLTRPRSPMLMTKHRIKHGEALSTEERIAAEMASMQNFKAKPVDKRVLEGAPIGIPQVEKAPLTVPMSPAIQKPKPPAPRPPSPPKVIKANPIRLPEQPFQPVIEHREIKPLDFHLPGDDISERKRREFEEELKKKAEEEERMRNFVARPILDVQYQPRVHVEQKAPTEPRPFHLMTEIRSHLHQQQAHLQAEREPSRSNHTFVAQPMPVFEPFIPKKSEKPITMPEEVFLRSEMRAEERKAFEEQRRQREQEEAEMRDRAKAEKEAKEREEIKRLRQQQVHQAQPIRHFNAVQLQPSSKKLTEPESPMLKDKRIRMGLPVGNVPTYSSHQQQGNVSASIDEGTQTLDDISISQSETSQPPQEAASVDTSFSFLPNGAAPQRRSFWDSWGPSDIVDADGDVFVDKPAAARAAQ